MPSTTNDASSTKTQTQQPPTTSVSSSTTSTCTTIPSSSSNNSSNQPQQEKPTHYKYLKEFRVEQCPSFLQHKCTQHKPFTCFNWHFNNQRRRRPVKKVRDGMFNYSADVYCTKYDETTGLCPDGDDCPYLHRTAGDTERRYHLKYYKTGICIYDTDTRGFCVKNGPHCAFAHGVQDLRNPVYDVREMEANGPCANGSLINGTILGNLDGSNVNGAPNSLDKERNALNEDPRWQDNIYVLANYKTDLCKRPPRLCRQGYACPQYHNSKDKRRTPKTFKYRSTPCPNVKQGDEWGDPINCEAGDNCQYCHTRTEQQFHPEIYKSTKCHDIQQTGYCPRGPFCAFAHGDNDETLSRYEFPDENGSTIVGRSVHGGNGNGQKVGNVASSLPDHYTSIFGGSGWSSGGQVSSSGGGGGNGSRGGERDRSSSIMTPSSSSSSSGTGERNSQFPSSLGAIGQRPRSFSTSITCGSSHNTLSRLLEGRDKVTSLGTNGSPSTSMNDRRSSGIYDSNSPIFTSFNLPNSATGTLVPSTDSGDYGDAAGTVGSMVGSVLDDITIDDAMANIAIDAAVTAGDPLRGDHSFDHRIMNGGDSLPTGSNTILGSAPVNIPGPRVAGASGTLNVSPPFAPGSHHHNHVTSGSPGPAGFAPSFNPHNNSHASSFDPFGPFGPLGATTGPGIGNSSPTNSTNVVVQAAASILEINRLKEELRTAQQKISSYEESMHQAVNLWKAELEEARQREDQLQKQVTTLQVKMHMSGGGNGSDGLNGMIGSPPLDESNLESMSMNQLQQLKQKLKNELDCVDRICRLKLSIN